MGSRHRRSSSFTISPNASGRTFRSFFTAAPHSGMGRGEIVEQIEDFCEEFVLIVTPDVAVATRDAFNRLKVRSLTKQDSERILRLCRFGA